MELTIYEARCVICDPSVDLMVDSSGAEMLSDAEKGFISKKIKKIRNSSEMNKGKLLKEQLQGTILDDYLQKRISLDRFSREIASQISEKKKEAGKYSGFDVFVVDGTVDECRFLAILDCLWNSGYTHYTEAIEGKTVNRIIEYKTLLSEGILKEDHVFFYDLLNETVLLKECSLEINQKKQKLFSDLLFPCGSSPSEKEVLKVVSDTAWKLSEKYELAKNEVMPMLKAAINEAEVLDIEEIAEEVFENHPDICHEFVAEIKEAGIENKVPFEAEKLKKKDRMIHFVTETGIELAIPVQYMKRRDRVEIVNHPDGTISIELKNINDLKNRK